MPEFQQTINPAGRAATFGVVRAGPTLVAQNPLAINARNLIASQIPPTVQAQNCTGYTATDLATNASIMAWNQAHPNCPPLPLQTVQQTPAFDPMLLVWIGGGLLVGGLAVWALWPKE